MLTVLVQIFECLNDEDFQKIVAPEEEKLLDQSRVNKKNSLLLSLFFLLLFLLFSRKITHSMVSNLVNSFPRGHCARLRRCEYLPSISLPPSYPTPFPKRILSSISATKLRIIRSRQTNQNKNRRAHSPLHRFHITHSDFAARAVLKEKQRKGKAIKDTDSKFLLLLAYLNHHAVLYCDLLHCSLRGRRRDKTRQRRLVKLYILRAVATITRRRSQANMIVIS